MKKILALLLALVMCVGVFAGCVKNNGGVTLDQAKDYLYNVMKDKNGKEIRNDYDVVGKIIIDEVSFEVTWTTDNENIKIKASSKANMWTVDLPDVNASVVEYKLIATIKAADGSTIQVTFTPKLPVLDNTGVTSTPEAGVAYKIFFEQVNLGYTLYALNTTQDNKNKFINTTLDPKEAADFYVEVVDGGYKIYTDINGVKNYVHATATPKADGNGYTKTIGFATETESVFVYNSELSTFYVQISGEKFGVGTYGSYETISISELTKHFTPNNINVADGQFPIGFMTSAYAETLTPDEKPVVNDPAANSTLTIAQAIELGNTKIKDQYTTGKYYVTGKITEVQNETYGNLVISDGTNSILVYGTYDANGVKKYGEMENAPKVGDTITVYGVVGKYNDAQLKNAWITNVVPGEGGTTNPPSGGDQGGTTNPPSGGDQGGTTNPPSGGDQGGTTTNTYTVVDNPIAGTAYKFGMVQGNVNNKVFYLVGGMDGFYMATTDNVDAAIDVYLEATTGGYYLYTMVGGTKTYINMVVSGTHVNGAYEATASTVYTYDAQSKTIIASVTVEDTAADYWFGTRNDKTYTTAGPCAVSYNGFYCQFYAVSEGGNQGGTTTPPSGGDQGGTTNPPSGGDQGGTTTNTYTVVDNPVAGTAYKFGMVQGNVNNKVFYLVGGMDGYYMATTDNVDAAIDVYLEATTGGYYLYTMVGGTKTYINMVVSGTHVNGAYEATASTVYTYDAQSKTIIASVTVEDTAADYWFGTRNDKNYTTAGPCAVSYAGFYCQFYAVSEGGNQGGAVTPPPTHEHTYVNGECACGATDPNYVPPTTSAITSITEAMSAAVGTKVVLTGVVIAPGAWNTQYGNMDFTLKDESGATILVFRSSTQVGLGDTVTVTGEIGVYNEVNQVAQGATVTISNVHGENHTYSGGYCTVCGSAEPVAGSVEISFADKANRTEFTTSKQVWEQNGITVTNDKASSTSSVADYAGPARFYKNSNLTVAYTGMTKIVFECNSASYATALQASLSANTGVTVTVNGNMVEVTFSAPTNTFTVTLSGGQVRMNGLTVVAN